MDHSHMDHSHMDHGHGGHGDGGMGDMCSMNVRNIIPLLLFQAPYRSSVRR